MNKSHFNRSEKNKWVDDDQHRPGKSFRIRIKNTALTVLLVTLIAFQTFSQVAPGKLFDHYQDIGLVQFPGKFQYSDTYQEYTLTGSGENIWFEKDAFFFSWRKMKGNFILRARVSFTGKGKEPHRKTGWMIRTGTDADDAHVSAVIHGDGLASLQYRKAKGDITLEIQSDLKAPDVIQLERRDGQFIMSVARFGEPFKTVETSEIELGDQVLAGLFICAHNKDVSEKAVFKNVRIVQPAGPGLIPYRNYLASNLEILNIQTGERKIVYQSPTSIQAPNWTRDGQFLIYNKSGLIYKFNLNNNRTTILNTGFAKSNNNDHVISFDGKLLGISNHDETRGQSLVYYLPLEGGAPVQVTEKGPSYLHGWSTDGRYVVYTGSRNGEFDIYKKAIDNKTPEIRLTHAKGLDDGPEYAPDGKYIYFNSNRNGTMQIWRMKPDGSEQEQLTFDPYNDWFPHLSPDGKMMVFISFPASVDPGDHPFYKHVYLRTMPVSGGSPKVIAYLYGGQGTINVPSWSPHGTRIAFVSNSGTY